MAPTTFTTRELSERTWPDYVRFFSQGNGWDHCGCTAPHGFRAPSSVRKWADKRDWNLELKRSLMERDLAHGILVYGDEEPVGWCQFGPKDEVPLPRDQRMALLKGDKALTRARDTGEPGTSGGELGWRITCFCTSKQFAQRGIAGVALHAALEAIQKRGGGLVEAFPVVLVPQSDERLIGYREWRRTRSRLIRAHGRFSDELERHLSSPPEPIPVLVDGVGEVNGRAWSYGAMCPGTVRMFQREGFAAVRPLGPGPRVVVQKVV